MKRIALFTALLVLAVTNAFAGVYFDAKSSYCHSWSTNDQDSSDKINQDNTYGGFVGAGYYVHEQFSVRTEFGYSYVEPVRDTVEGDYTADVFHFLVCMEFIPYIPLLADYRVFLINSFSVGYVSVSLDTEGQMQGSDTGSGVQLLLTTGILYQFSQHAAPFITFGWTSIYYSGEWDGITMNMLNINIGVRFFLFNPRTLQ